MELTITLLVAAVGFAVGYVLGRKNDISDIINSYHIGMDTARDAIQKQIDDMVEEKRKEYIENFNANRDQKDDL